jgi:hypothetical protein
MTKYWVQQREQGTTEGSSGLGHRTVSGAPPDMSGAPEALRYNSPDCPVYTGQCSVLQGKAPQELASLGKLLHYNSPDCPVYTRLSGEPAEQRLVRANGHLQRH